MGAKDERVIAARRVDKTDGKQWKMFIYYTDNGHFCYSYQDQNYWDTMTYPSIDLEQMIALMLEDMHEVDGIEWIAVDF